jgi:hypothetical protein
MALACLGATAPQSPTAIGPQGALCHIGEAVLASCAVGKKLVSVCGVDGKSTYRFGTLERLDIELTNLRTASRGFAGGGETQIQARNGAFTYLLFDSTVAGAWDGEGHRAHDFSSGLSVMKDGRIVSHETCTGHEGTAINSSALDHFMPQGSIIEH